jgi:hypothetical protein
MYSIAAHLVTFVLWAFHFVRACDENITVLLRWSRLLRKRSLGLQPYDRRAGIDRRWVQVAFADSVRRVGLERRRLVLA